MSSCGLHSEWTGTNLKKRIERLLLHVRPRVPGLGNLKKRIESSKQGRGIRTPTPTNLKKRIESYNPQHILSQQNMAVNLKKRIESLIYFSPPSWQGYFRISKRELKEALSPAQPIEPLDAQESQKENWKSISGAWSGGDIFLRISKRELKDDVIHLPARTWRSWRISKRELKEALGQRGAPLLHRISKRELKVFVSTPSHSMNQGMESQKENWKTGLRSWSPSLINSLNLKKRIESSQWCMRRHPRHMLGISKRELKVRVEVNIHVAGGWRNLKKRIESLKLAAVEHRRSSPWISKRELKVIAFIWTHPYRSYRIESQKENWKAALSWWRWGRRGLTNLKKRIERPPQKARWRLFYNNPGNLKKRIEREAASSGRNALPCHQDLKKRIERMSRTR